MALQKMFFFQFELWRKNSLKNIGGEDKIWSRASIYMILMPRDFQGLMEMETVGMMEMMMEVEVALSG